MAIVQALLAAGASTTLANAKGMTALLDAAEAGYADVVDALLAVPGIDVRAKSKYGDGALELSKWARDAAEIEEMLTAAGAEWQSPDHHADSQHDYHHGDDHHGSDSS